jgi:hypothetical protein
MTRLPCFVGDADRLLARVPGIDLKAHATLWLLTQGEARNPVFDVHYNARIGGRNAVSASKIPYALVITIESKKTRNLYNRILQRYPTILEPLRPVVEIPIRT